MPRAAAISQPDQVLPPNTDELGPQGLSLLLRELLSANFKLRIVTSFGILSK